MQSRRALVSSRQQVLAELMKLMKVVTCMAWIYRPVQFAKPRDGEGLEMNSGIGLASVYYCSTKEVMLTKQRFTNRILIVSTLAIKILSTDKQFNYFSYSSPHDCYSRPGWQPFPKIYESSFVQVFLLPALNNQSKDDNVREEHQNKSFRCELKDDSNLEPVWIFKVNHSDCIDAVIAILRLGQEILVTFDVDIEVVVTVRNGADDIPSPTVVGLQLVGDCRGSIARAVAGRLYGKDGVVDCGLEGAVDAASF